MSDLDRIALERMIERNQSILDSHARGIPVPLIARMTGLDENYIQALVEKVGVRPTADFVPEKHAPWAFQGERNSEIVRLYEAGTRPKDIAEAYGIQPPTVQQILTRYSADRGKHWTSRGRFPRDNERDKQICELYMTGKTLEEVGQLYNITRERVRQILVLNNIQERFNGFFKPERIEGRQRQEARAQIAQGRRDDRRQEREKARAMYNDGHTYSEIAIALKHSICWVQQAIWKTGGPSRNGLARKPKKKITPEQRQEIGRRYAANELIEQIAKAFDIAPGVVPQVANQGGFYRPGFGPGINACKKRAANGEAQH